MTTGDLQDEPATAEVNSADDSQAGAEERPEPAAPDAARSELADELRSIRATGENLNG